jgi:hypothetical protein
VAQPQDVIELVESVPQSLELTFDQAAALASLGRRMASSKSWWGDPEGETKEKTVIRVRSEARGRWEVRVADAVGAVSIGDLQLLVQPKITNEHLLYLFARSGHYPRLEASRANLAAARSLWELVAAWFVDAVEVVLRRDLIRDYQDHTDELAFVRGRIQTLATSRSLLKGRAFVSCDFDEFDADNPMNRVLLAAASVVARSPVLPSVLRQRSRRVALRLDGVGPLRRKDLRVQVDRRTSHYRDALILGRSVLEGGGRSLSGGPEAAWTFLIRTPEMVEEGLRRILVDALAGSHKLTKQGLQLQGSTKTLNPDLVFDGGSAIGDVKYKLTGKDWRTADLYQSVAFATGFGAKRSLVVTFGNASTPLPALQVGDVRVTNLVWQASDTVQPAAAGTLLASQVMNWLERE